MSVISENFAASLAACARRRHRALLVLSGSADWCRARATPWYEACALPKCWLGAGVGQAVSPAASRTLLGTEQALVVVDAHSGLHPDALAAVAGTVVAGGALLLLTPAWQQWGTAADGDYARLASYPQSWQRLPARFLARLRDVIAAAPPTAHWHECDGDAALPSHLPFSMPLSLCRDETALPDDEQAQQLRSIEAHHGVSVLLAARGRGKSALLGFAARQWLAAGRRVLLVAPARRSAASVFRHAGPGLVFVAPDQLLQDASLSADVLLVDEASAIPLPLLQHFLQRFPHAVLAATTEGYEGTGQGFVLRLLRELDGVAPGWQRLTLAAPVRWAADDPLERCLYEALLLDAHEAALPAASDPACAVFEQLSQQQLADDPRLLREWYGLLRSAHYRTTPDDLRFLLDAPGLSLYRLALHGHTLAVALLLEEGSLDEAMADAIAAGRRRPRGHLLVQTLAVHEKQPQYLRQRVARVVRIAVHTQHQGQGLGSRLLQAVVADQRARGVEIVGSSFSATPEVLAFWQKNGFRLLRIGHKRQAASAAPSAIVLQP